MKQYNVDQFLEDVKKEAQALRENATDEELGNLSFEKMHPSRRGYCIYGLMTGHCDSARATTLIFNCCARFVKNPGDSSVSIGDLMEWVNGEKIDGIKTANDFTEYRETQTFHLSAIEAYIMTPEAKNANLISYLKGETDTLEL